MYLDTYRGGSTFQNPFWPIVGVLYIDSSVWSAGKALNLVYISLMVLQRENLFSQKVFLYK